MTGLLPRGATEPKSRPPHRYFFLMKTGLSLPGTGFAVHVCRLRREKGLTRHAFRQCLCHICFIGTRVDSQSDSLATRIRRAVGKDLYTRLRHGYRAEHSFSSSRRSARLIYIKGKPRSRARFLCRFWPGCHVDRAHSRGFCSARNLTSAAFLKQRAPIISSRKKTVKGIQVSYCRQLWSILIHPRAGKTHGDVPLHCLQGNY